MERAPVITPQVMESLTQAVSQYCIVPQRVLLSLFGFLAIVNAYTMRLCLDTTLTQIVVEQVPQNATAARWQLNALAQRAALQSLDARKTLQRALKYDAPKQVVLANDAKQNWSEQMQTFILISFYVGYVLAHLPGAQLAERYGAKWVLTAGIALAAVFTLLTPMAIRMGGPFALVVMRVMIGLSEGPTFPALSALLSKWVPAKERGTLGVLVLSGSQIGISLAGFMSGLLLQISKDWAMIFYFFGGCAVLWCIGFICLCYSEPESNPFIKEAEKLYLQRELSGVVHKNELPVTPWKDIFRSLPVWALISATVQYDWTQLQSANNVQQFIKDMKQLPLSENFLANLHNSLPYIMNWIVSLLSGVVSDLLINYKILSTTMTRKVMAVTAAMVPDLFTSLAPCFTCHENDSVAFFNCAIAVLGTYYAGIKLTPLDMSPNFAGTLMGIANGFGSLTGVVEPFFRNVATRFTHFKELRALVWFICTMLISGEVQSFNQPITTLHKNE